MKKSILLLFLIQASVLLIAQRKTTTSAIIAFDASTAIDNLPKAENKTAVAAIDLEKKTVQFEAAIKNFSFANPRIQDHFNQKGWMNSDEFPKAVFNGAVTNPASVNFKKDGTYEVTVTGDLTIKGKTNKIITPATIVVSGSTIKTSAAFNVKLSDYGIEGASVDAGKVSREPKISITADFN